MADHAESYIQKIQQHNQEFAERLLKENDRLRAVVGALEREKLRMEEELVVARRQQDSYQLDQIRLQRQVAEIESESRKYFAEYAQLEQQNSNLANLYVASYRLHGSLDRQEVVATIQEIINNLIGSEELALYELGDTRRTLNLIVSQGIDQEQYRTMPLDRGIISRSIATGDIIVAADSSVARTPFEEHLTVAIPLKVDGRSAGVIAIFRLLQQKTAGLESIDHELFELLATHAATALYCAGLHVRAAQGTQRAA